GGGVGSGGVAGGGPGSGAKGASTGRSGRLGTVSGLGGGGIFGWLGGSSGPARRPVCIFRMVFSFRTKRRQGRGPGKSTDLDRRSRAPVIISDLQATCRGRPELG